MELVGVITPDDIAAARLAGRVAVARSLTRSHLLRSARPIAGALRTRLGRLVTPGSEPSVVAAPAVTPSILIPPPTLPAPSANGHGEHRPVLPHPGTVQP